MSSGTFENTRSLRASDRLQRFRDRCADAAAKTPPLVQHYTEVLMLPFRVTSHGPFSLDTTSLQAITERLPSAFNAAWDPVPGATISANVAPDDQSELRWDRLQHYQAFAYFHPTVRNFLFGSKSADTSWATNPEKAKWTNDYLKVYRHKFLKRISVTVWHPGEKRDRACGFDVLRCDLAFMQPDVGVLLLELKAKFDDAAGWPLSLMQQVRDRLRRLYPPYFDDSGRGGHYPSHVEFKQANDHEAPLYESAAFDHSSTAFAGVTLDAQHLPIDCENSPCAGHWNYLLTGLRDRSSGMKLILPGDDRLPSMAFVAVDDPRSITEGDWMRLTYANEAGNDRLPYSRKLLADFEKRHCYDRFWIAPEDSTHEPSRILNCGYAFTMVGSFADKDFFMNPRNGALATFRQIYVRMGMIAHFQKTALLGATARLSALSWRDSASGTLRPYGEREAAIMNLYQHFIEFNHVFWFDEVSPQEQGVELFAMWQRELRSQELYDEVRQELKDLVEYVGAERAKAQAETAHRFTRTAAVLGGLGVVAGLLGMNILPFKDGEFVPGVFDNITKGAPIVGYVWKYFDGVKSSEPIVNALIATGVITALAGAIAYFFHDFKYIFPWLRRKAFSNKSTNVDTLR